MTTFGDIRSAVQAKSKEQLHNALAHYKGPQPTDAETHYIIDAALRHDWNLGIHYERLTEWAFDGVNGTPMSLELMPSYLEHHPIRIKITPESMRCSIHVGRHRYALGVLPRKAAQQWLLDCVIKPMRLWFIDESFDPWGQVETGHARRIDSGVLGFLREAIPVSVYRACNNSSIMDAAMTNEVKRTCDGLVDAVWYQEGCDISQLLQDSFDQYVLHYFKLPKEGGLTAHQMQEREIELRAQQAFRASAMQSGPYKW